MRTEFACGIKKGHTHQRHFFSKCGKMETAGFLITRSSACRLHFEKKACCGVLSFFNPMGGLLLQVTSQPMKALSTSSLALTWHDQQIHIIATASAIGLMWHGLWAGDAKAWHEKKLTRPGMNCHGKAWHDKLA